jgi:hypothetical protein
VVELTTTRGDTSNLCRDKCSSNKKELVVKLKIMMFQK